MEIHYFGVKDGHFYFVPERDKDLHYDITFIARAWLVPYREKDFKLTMAGTTPAIGDIVCNTHGHWFQVIGTSGDVP